MSEMTDRQCPTSQTYLADVRGVHGNIFGLNRQYEFER